MPEEHASGTATNGPANQSANQSAPRSTNQATSRPLSATAAAPGGRVREGAPRQVRTPRPAGVRALFPPRAETVRAKAFARVRSALAAAAEQCADACPAGPDRDAGVRLLTEAMARFDRAIEQGGG